MAENESRSCSDTLLRDIEILLTASFFDYARRNWGGMDDELKHRAGWFIVREEADYLQLLKAFLHNGQPLREPVYRQFGLLRDWLKRYDTLEKSWPNLNQTELESLVPGDTTPVAAQLRTLLALAGDLPHDSGEPLFDSVLITGLRAFQERHGLDHTGLPDGPTARELATPIHSRIEQIMINMERCRWVPHEITGSYVVVNIPQFKMHVYENDRLLWSCKAIVGKSNALNKTVVFNDSIETIVFNPYWNIPKNILVREIMPQVRSNKHYLEEKNMEVVDASGKELRARKIDWDDTTNIPFIVREKPGPGNSLGKVKFLFPNPYDIYLHDTPARDLFNLQQRSFSHGCIRISEPVRLAEYLLRENPRWTSEKINHVILRGEEAFVKLPRKVPVFIAYFTAWVDRQGRVNFGRDIYGHDAEMRRLLFSN